MKQALIKTVIAFIIFTAALLSPFLFEWLGSQDAESKKFVKQTQEIIKSEYKSSTFEFKKSLYFKDHNDSYSNLGVVCGEVRKKDYDDDYAGFRKYYAVVRSHEGNIGKLLRVEFDVFKDDSTSQIWIEYCENN
ncbi:hypothetical protein JK188_12865 [Providencia sp. JGM181]|uniref:hypothetical protein n=1 Tax=unclassified Providencia TaxID=2633465 RepID=UPI001BAB4EF4|nr:MULTISPECIES: hypothetical protein [unclassified Providencia]MBS0925371.1 hypothetical protein [Providencia sp. JGM181]MBS0932839.1 hypothetical protein [Providencia sp. JGM172]MBS0997032.1 hypothetical protein [Providencia sp. JGM178]